MKITWLGITWASAQNIVFLPLLCIALFMVVWYYRKKRRIVELLAARQWRASLVLHFSAKKNSFKACCYVLGFIFLFLALLQPQWDKKEEQVQQQGRDLVFALDISRSMLAQDIKPNRLAFAKEKIKKLLPMLASERIGLLLFSGESIVQCPLTTDYDAFLLFLEQLDVETISSGTTALDKALQKVILMFKEQPLKKNKLLVIFTDGEDFSSNLSQIKEEARAINLPIITVGIGTLEGAPIPVVDEQGAIVDHQRDETGGIVISRLNEGILSSLSQSLDGLYILASTKDDADLKKITNYIERIEKESFDDKKISSLENQYFYFIAVSFLCFALGWLL